MRQNYALFLLLFSTAFLRAEDTPDPKQIEALIQKMDANDAGSRESAFRQLATIGFPARAALEAAVKNSQSHEVRMRAERLLALCVPAGEVVNGLRLGLSADKTTLKLNQSVKLTLTVINVSEETVVFYEGLYNRIPKNHTGLDAGNNFKLMTIDKSGAGTNAVSKPQSSGSFGSAAGPRAHYAAIAPVGSSVYVKTFVFNLPPDPKPKAEEVDGFNVGGIGIGTGTERNGVLIFDKPGTYKLRASCSNDKKEIRLGQSEIRSRNLDGKSAWTGELQSNEITITVEPAEVPAPQPAQ